MRGLAEARVDALAEQLHRARLARAPITPVTDRHPNFSESDAYRVQAQGISLRAVDGEALVGAKLGFTSRAMRAAMGVDRPNFGWLTDAMIIGDGRAPLASLIHPKVEPEIALMLGEDLNAPVGTADVLAAVRWAVPALEVVDSRYEDFRFRSNDNIADNSSAAMVALGSPVPFRGIDLARVGVVVSVNGEMLFTAAGAAAFDHPGAAAAWMINTCGKTLPEGSVIITGGLTAPVNLTPGTGVIAEFDRLGTITLAC